MSLEKFLLRSSQTRSAWLWIPQWRIRPDQQYSWLRLLGFVAIRAARAYVLTRTLITIIALISNADDGANAVSSWSLIVDCPNLWIAWTVTEFLALKALAQGLITRPAWNRRASILATANDTEASALVGPSPRTITGPILGFLYFLLIGVLTPLVMFHAVEDFRGITAYQNRRSELIASGERLRLSELISPKPRDEDNFFATPFWKQFEYDRVPTNGGTSYTVQWKNRNGSEFPYKTNLTLPELPENKKSSGKELPSLPSANDGRIKLAEWAAAFREATTNLPSPSSGRPVLSFPLPPSPGKPFEDVLLALSKFDATLSEFSEASNRPRNVYPTHFEEGFGTLLPNLAAFKSIARIFQLRAAARLESGDSSGALKDARMIFRFGEALQEDPFLITQLVRIAIENIGFKTLWIGLADHRWNDAQLVELLQILQKRQFGPAFIRSLEGERAMAIETLDRALTGPGNIFVDLSFMNSLGSGDGVDSFLFSPGPFRPGMFLIPAGWCRQSQLSLLNGYQRLLVQARQELNPTNSGYRFAGKVGESSTVLGPKRRPFDILVNMLLPALDKASTKAAVAETVTRLAITACALERFHLAHGEFPKTLDELAPQYVAVVPTDYMTAQPLHYERTDDGWYRLWSVGQDGKDDGGVYQLPDKRLGSSAFGPVLDIPWPRPIASTEKRIF